MGSPPGPIPPAPTNDGGLGSQDQPTTANYDPTQTTDAQWQYAKAHADEIAQTLGAIHEKSGIVDRAIAKAGGILGHLVVWLAEAEGGLLDEWASAEVQLFQGAVEPLAKAGAAEAAAALELLILAMDGGATEGPSYTSSEMGQVAQELFESIILPFTLVNSGIDPTQLGSGVKTQQYMLSKAASLSLQEWIVESIGQHFGMSMFKSLGPFLQIIDHSINPSNLVRQSMDASLTALLKAPLQRDMNYQYPVKDLGATAIAHLYMRGAIDLNTYLDRCQKLGLSNEYAQQLLLESKKMLSRGDIAQLLKAGYITSQDANDLLTQQGYSADETPAILYLDTHARYFSIQERIGTAAVSAWARGYIDQQKLETILQQVGFTSDEIQLLEMEQQFAKFFTQPKALTYSQIKAMYEQQIVGIDAVLTFLQNEGYSQQDVINLVLLDFVKAEQRALTLDQLQARLRVTAEEDRVQAIAAQKKNEAALAKAKNDLAAELDAEAKAYGALTTAAGMLQLLGLA